jgi:ankyrin repeat protein
MRGADVNTRDAEGRSAIFYAAARGEAKVCHLLLSRGASVDLAGRDGMGPLQVAVAGGHDKVVSLLLSHAARVACTSCGASGGFCGKSHS